MFSTLAYIGVGGFADVVQNGGFAVFSAVLGAALSVGFAIWDQAAGWVDGLQRRRRIQKDERVHQDETREERERSDAPAPEEAEDRAAEFFDWPPRHRAELDRGPGQTGELPPPDGEEPRPPGESRLRAWLASLRESTFRFSRWVKDLVALALIAPWVFVVSALLLFGLVALDSLARSLGFSDEVARAAVVTDAVLLTLAGAWIVTGVRTRRRTPGQRVLQAAVLVLLLVAVVALAIGTESLPYGLALFVFAMYVYARMFP
jgi:hypothetical protein